MSVPFLYAVSLALCVTLAALAIWSRTLWPRIGAVALLLCFVPVGLGGLAALTGEPRRANLEWLARNVEDIEVRGFDLREGIAIFVYATVPGYDRPQSYEFPWSTPQAEQLQDAAAKAEAEGGTLRLRRPFDSSLDEMPPVFYSDPPEALPEKQVTAPAPVTVE